LILWLSVKYSCRFACLCFLKAMINYCILNGTQPAKIFIIFYIFDYCRFYSWLSMVNNNFEFQFKICIKKIIITDNSIELVYEYIKRTLLWLWIYYITTYTTLVVKSVNVVKTNYLILILLLHHSSNFEELLLLYILNFFNTIRHYLIYIYILRISFQNVFKHTEIYILINYLLYYVSTILCIKPLCMSKYYTVVKVSIRVLGII